MGEQGAVVDRIDEHVTQTAVTVKSAGDELSQAEQWKRSNARIKAVTAAMAAATVLLLVFLVVEM